MTSGPVLSEPLIGYDTSLKLLLIEDSLADSELVLATLEDDLPRATVRVATTLEDALVQLGEDRYDAVLADLSLPDAEGLSVVHSVRAAHPDTALLVLTGRGDSRLALWALAQGAQDYLVKGQGDGTYLAAALVHGLQRQRTEDEGRKYLQLARGLLDALDEATCAVTLSGEVVAVNESWRTFMTGNGGLVGACGEGTNYLAVCDRVDPRHHDFAVATATAMGLRAVLADQVSRFQHDYACHSPGEDRWFSVRIAPAVVEGSPGAVISHIDITEMHQLVETLSHQALHDSLTGLPNRALLIDRLTQALVDSRRRQREVGVAFLDLDHFKRVNDSLGHPAGDALLIQVAGRLTEVLRSSDTLARISGDEFVVVWRDLASADDVAALSERLLSVFSEPFEIAMTEVEISASVGVSIGGATHTCEDVLQAADTAMYDAKTHGRNRVRVFSDELRLSVLKRMATEAGLRTALAEGQLVLHYQPVMDLTSGRPVGVEALVRWQHPQDGLLGPNVFIPIAESSGLVVPLGAWALHQACNDVMKLSGSGAGLDIAVNLSTRQLTEPDLLSHVQAALSSSRLQPERLVLEVTESAVVEDDAAAAGALDALSALGVRISIDDFGTGYSSLLYLRRYPISALKVDRAFVSGLGLSADDEAICSSVIDLAHAVGATSTGEGVETMDQYAALRAFGCQQGQGYLWSPAVPIEDLESVLTGCLEVPIPSADQPPLSLRHHLDAEVSTRIAVMRRDGASLQSIATNLNNGSLHNSLGRGWTAGDVARHLAATAAA
jgi:diguanylate cyclase (GGDEF)-like protein